MYYPLEVEPQSSFALLIEPDLLLFIHRPDQEIVASFKDMPETKMLQAVSEAWMFGFRAMAGMPTAMYVLGRCVTRWSMVGITLAQIIRAISDPGLKEFYRELERQGGGFS